MARPQNLLTNAAEGLGRSMPPRLSIDMNRFTLVDGSGNEKPVQSLHLDVVFIDLNPKTSKMYFGRPYNPNDTEPPLCWSDNGTAPSSQAATPQAATCMACPHNVIGSAISQFSQAKIKACVDQKKLAFIIPDDPSRLVYLMTLKPGSFKNWSSTINWLKGQRFGDVSPDLCDIVLRLEFESQGVLKFTPVQAVIGNAALEAQREEAWSRNVTDAIVGKDDVPFSGNLLPAAATPVQQLAPPPQQAAAPAFNQPQAQVAYQMPAQVQQPAPFAPPASAVPSNVPSVGSSEPARRTRRTKAQIAADNAAQNPQPAPTPAFAPPQQQATPPATGQAAELEIPPFLRRDQTAPAPAAPPIQQFGMGQPAAPDADMQAAIAKAFSLPT